MAVVKAPPTSLSLRYVLVTYFVSTGELIAIVCYTTAHFTCVIVNTLETTKTLQEENPDVELVRVPHVGSGAGKVPPRDSPHRYGVGPTPRVSLRLPYDAGTCAMGHVPHGTTTGPSDVAASPT